MKLDDIVSGGLDAIKRIIADQLEENHKIDYKVKTDPNSLDLSREDKQALGESVSGFANAEGGVLLIGIKTERPFGVDRASLISPIANVHAVRDRYASYISECSAPPVSEVKVEAIVVSEDGSGVLVIEIPKGDSRPHMSIAPKHHRFYRRTSDRFEQMERYEIEEMFGIRKIPKIDLLLEYQNGGSIGNDKKSYILFGIQNVSQTVAKFPFISLSNNRDAPRLAKYGLDGNGGTALPKALTIPGRDILFSGNSDIVLHPNQSLFVSKLEYIHSHNPQLRYWSASQIAQDQYCEIEFSVGCEDMPSVSYKVRFNTHILINHDPPLIERLQQKQNY